MSQSEKAMRTGASTMRTDLEHPTATVYGCSSPIGVLAIDDAFKARVGENGSPIVEGTGFTRTPGYIANGWECLLDSFPDADAVCCFVRFRPDGPCVAHLSVNGEYRITKAPAGGWLLKPGRSDLPTYWAPLAPQLRSLDSSGHILAERPPELIGFEAGVSELLLALHVPAGFVLDWVIWRLLPGSALVSELELLHPVEAQPIFLWSSHTVYTKPADLYLHLVHGHVYENHTVWPKNWKVCSELDAYALYVAFRGFYLATSKLLYQLFLRQTAFSVIARLTPDGSWRHGEWTDGMEAHYRLQCAGIRLLITHYASSRDNVVGSALKLAVAHIAESTDRLKLGVWFLHDSLEKDTDSMRRSPFSWIESRALGKSVSNMLVLNTHLDALITLDWYQQITGDKRYQDLLISARKTAQGVLSLRPAEWLYGLIFWAIRLTMLPAHEARTLPLPIRAIKRLTWKYLTPYFHHLKARFPRYAMLGGFVDRALTLQGFAHAYQPVHVWDLIRYRRSFPTDDLGTVLEEALAFTYSGPLRRLWKELNDKKHALGFWAEALYHLCLHDPRPEYRRWLAEALIDAEEQGIGLPPSVLGGNADAIPLAEQRPSPVVLGPNLRIANLSRGDISEILLINLSDAPAPLGALFAMGALPSACWVGSYGPQLSSRAPQSIPGRGWVWGRWEQAAPTVL